jgi:hypothetical protein
MYTLSSLAQCGAVLEDYRYLPELYGMYAEFSNAATRADFYRRFCADVVELREPTLRLPVVARRAEEAVSYFQLS